MTSQRESLISAHHNYLVNDMLTPGFVLGDPGDAGDFWFVADVVRPGETVPRISGRILDEKGRFLAELRSSRLALNPGGCVLRPGAGGFGLVSPSGEMLLSVHTQVFTNGYLTRIQGKLYDRSGVLRMEPSHEGAKVYGEARLTLEAPVGEGTVVME
ncbi:MAG: hypothetical protein AB1512_15660 [Thermodesulfobacteriota bacterium]